MSLLFMGEFISREEVCYNKKKRSGFMDVLMGLDIQVVAAWIVVLLGICAVVRFTQRNIFGVYNWYRNNKESIYNRWRWLFNMKVHNVGDLFSSDYSYSVYYIDEYKEALPDAEYKLAFKVSSDLDYRSAVKVYNQVSDYNTPHRSSHSKWINAFNKYRRFPLRYNNITWFSEDDGEIRDDIDTRIWSYYHSDRSLSSSECFLKFSLFPIVILRTNGIPSKPSFVRYFGEIYQVYPLG